MAETMNSKLLEQLLSDAKHIADDIHCDGVTRDLVFLAAINILHQPVAKLADYNQQEVAALHELLRDYPKDDQTIQLLKNAWKGQSLPMSERMIMSSLKGRVNAEARQNKQTVVTANLFLNAILSNESAVMKRLRRPASDSTPSSHDRMEELLRAARMAADAPDERKPIPRETKPEKAEQPAASKMTMREIVSKTKKLQKTLQEKVLGQQYAVSTFAAGYFQSQLQAATGKDRTRPLATFLFAGPPGVGKTFLSETAASILELPYRRFDMSEYATPTAVDELSGSDKNYKGSAEGLLTGFVHKNPECVLLFDEIEKAGLDVIHLFLQILDAGRLRDNRTDEEISFKDAILIFTTNAGKTLYEGGEAENLSTMSRTVILDALRNDINPRTSEPFFPAAICSRFASGNVVMLNYLGAHTLRSMVARQLDQHAADLAEAMNIQIEIDPTVPTALLLAEGSAADGRTVKSRADSFFGSEIYELYRLISSDRVEARIEDVCRIHISVDVENASPEVRKLFVPKEPVHAIAYMDQPLQLNSDRPDMPVIHYAHSVEEAEKLLETNKIELLLCDPFVGKQGSEHFLNREDIDSSSRTFLLEMMTRHPGIPVLLTESNTQQLSDEERTSYLRRGVRDFLNLDGGQVVDRLCTYSNRIFQQNSLDEIARANQVLHFETAQQLNPDGVSAEVLLFDMKLERAIKAEDIDSVTSMLSMPDKCFDDVVGAEDAKSELKFFVSFMKEPLKYRRQGAATPKGVLLYGPPGTGKTMLAKAFAAESKATFIAVEGNQFMKKYVGEGAEMVHRLFATARRYAPAVIFIDEIDVITRKRTGQDDGSAHVHEAVLTALLAEMDGFSTDPSKPVFVLGATNYSVDQNSALSLDSAVLRRFDRRILIDLPNQENRRSFLSREIAKKPIFQVSDEEIDNLAERSGGMSLAQLTSVLDMAIRGCMQRGSQVISDADMEETFEQFNSGDKHVWSAESMRRTACHESGHALVSWLAGDKPTYVTIVSRGNYGGYMLHGGQEDRGSYTKNELLGRIRTSMAGRAAEIVYYGETEGISTGASGDLQMATDLARHMLCTYGMDETIGLAVADSSHPDVMLNIQDRVNEILKTQLDEAIHLIEANRSVMDNMVSLLLKFNNLKRADIDKLFANMV